MMNTKKSTLGHLYKYALILPGVIGTCLTIGQVTAQPVVASRNEAAAKPSVKPQGIYVVINAQIDKGILEGIGARLKDFNVDFNVKNYKYNPSNQLTSVEVEVNVPGIYKGSLTAGNGSEPISKNLVFFHESGGNKAGLTGDGGMPQELSERGRLVVGNNLIGLLILYDNTSMQLHGRVHTNWQHLQQ
jgi:hypothetical protein